MFSELGLEIFGNKNMRLITLTAKDFEEQLLELAPYNVYNHKFPKRLTGNLGDYLTFLQKVIHTGKLTSVSTVIVTEITKDNVKNKTPISLTLYAFGSFRRQFAAMTQLAKVLAPFYLETLVLPVIKPIFLKDWQAVSQLQGQIYTEVQKPGILGFSKNHAKVS
jgi:hypothetical protein